MFCQPRSPRHKDEARTEINRRQGLARSRAAVTLEKPRSQHKAWGRSSPATALAQSQCMMGRDTVLTGAGMDGYRGAKDLYVYSVPQLKPRGAELYWGRWTSLYFCANTRNEPAS